MFVLGAMLHTAVSRAVGCAAPFGPGKVAETMPSHAVFNEQSLQPMDIGPFAIRV